MAARISRSRRLLRATLLVYAAALLLTSIYPDPRALLPAGWNPSDLALHFGAYLLLGLLITLSLAGGADDGSERHPWLAAVLAILVGAIYGTLIEVAQIATGRTAELRDALANLAGVTFGAVLARAIRSLRRS